MKTTINTDVGPKFTITIKGQHVKIDMSPRMFSIIPVKGPKGDDGTIENLSVEATTLPAGSSATASYSGNTLTLGIPTGATGAAGVGVPTGGTTGQVLKKKSGTNYDTEWANESGGSTWGGITGTLSNQTDLQNALDAKAPASTTYTKTEVDNLIAAGRCLVLYCGTFSSLPVTVSNASIKSDMVVIKSEFGTPDAQSDDWTVTTLTGSLVISGTLTTGSSTNLTLYLVKPQ